MIPIQRLDKIQLLMLPFLIPIIKAIGNTNPAINDKDIKVLMLMVFLSYICFAVKLWTIAEGMNVSSADSNVNPIPPGAVTYGVTPI